MSQLPRFRHRFVGETRPRSFLPPLSIIPLNFLSLKHSVMQLARALLGRADKTAVLDVCGRTSSSGSIDKLILRPDSILIHRKRQEGVTSPRNVHVSTTVQATQSIVAIPTAAELPGTKLPHAMSVPAPQVPEAIMATAAEGGTAAARSPRSIVKSGSLLKRDSGKVRFA